MDKKQKKVKKVMREFKEGKLRSGSRKGPVVTIRKEVGLKDKDIFLPVEKEEDEEEEKEEYVEVFESSIDDTTKDL